ncbi:hypothetical protein BDW42DRAFT_6562 [Aspergillus taichungensis]|uniref:Uncharacterized protein n=1 Tax=Aspergillus taichungensis TaxID=482145 RepID=A0A2J5HJE3_9EURO|nr:hypothetical protein BDW42DRAFT_6562 [Aspergillus taichungensis]
MPSITIINDSDHLSSVSSIPSLPPSQSPPRLHRSPSIANLSRWVVNRISRSSLGDEYTGRGRSDTHPSHGVYNRRQRRPRRQQRQHRQYRTLKKETEDPQEENSDEEEQEPEIVEDSDDERLREEYAAYCRAFTGSGGPDPPSSSRSRWTMEASHHPGEASGSSSPNLPASAGEGEGGGGRGEEEYDVPSPYWDTLDQSHPRIQPPRRILTPALYVQNQAQAQAQHRNPPEDRPVRPWWSTARKWVCARP